MDITLKNLQKKIPIPKSKILKTAQSAVRQLKKRCQLPFFLSLVFAGPGRMRGVNKKYLGHDYVTDVLSFDLGQGMAEIIICPQMAAANARRFKTSTEKELMLYVVHGLLHLAGYDDHSPKDVAEMRKMEQKILGNE